MGLLRGRFRITDVAVIAVALIAAAAATVLLTRANEQLSRAAQSERILDEIIESSFALLNDDVQADDVRRADSRGARQIQEIESLDPELREILAEVTTAGDHFRQDVLAQLALVAARSSHAAEHRRTSLFPAQRTLTDGLSEADVQLEERIRRLRYELKVTSIAAVLLAVLGLALVVLLANRSKHARAKAQRVQLAAENQRLRDQTAVAELVMHVAHAADSTDSVKRLLERTLGLVCFHAGWPLGHIWMTEAGGGLEPSGIWHCEEPRCSSSSCISSRPSGTSRSCTTLRSRRSGSTQ